MALSSYSRDELLDALTATGTWVATATYVSLHTGDPALTGTNESADTNYARVQATGGTAFSVASGGASSNGGALTFASGTGWNASQTLTHCGIFDASTGGNFLIGGALDASVAVTAGAEVEFATGDLDLSMT